MLTHNCMIWIERGEKVLYFYIFISRSSEFLTCNGLYKFISSNFEEKKVRIGHFCHAILRKE